MRNQPVSRARPRRRADVASRRRGNDLIHALVRADRDRARPRLFLRNSHMREARRILVVVAVLGLRAPPSGTVQHPVVVFFGGLQGRLEGVMV